jgi:hypothetical protein
MLSPALVADETRRIISAIAKTRLPMSDEKALQAAIEIVLLDNGFTFTREALVAGGIIDFLAGAVGIEVKIKGPAREVLRQLTRYAEDDRIEHLVLVAAFPCAMPPMIGGKRCTIVDVGRAWL